MQNTMSMAKTSFFERAGTVELKRGYQVAGLKPQCVREALSAGDD
jgi:hypothetical protein